MSHFKKTFSRVVVAVSCSFMGAMTALAALDDESGLKATGDAAHISRRVDASALVGSTIQYLSGLIGALFLALIVYGGAMWMMSQGEGEKIKKAKAIITAAIIGMVVTVASYAIASYVIELAAVTI